MTFAGDFAQLPPAYGGSGQSLYSGYVGAKSDSMHDQHAAIGKALWHQVLTVVILQQNMRQRSQTIEDSRLRMALENMRYRKCTANDLAFLNTHVSSAGHGHDHISQPEYQNVSIITVWNSHKDEINHLGCKQFARETGQSLTCFYSKDFATETRKEKQDRKAHGLHRSTGITDELQQILWDLPSNANDGQCASTLHLCIGMPVMIRNNYATELCMMKGQEGVVHSWQVVKGSRGQQMLDVLFIKLLNPPSEVQLVGLPKNVVPLERKTITINCKMPNDKVISLSRSQVDIALNFAMTDYSSQGKTRPYNPVHLDYCKSHQACYTALSRTASAKGTILLQPISPSKVQGGVHGSLRQDVAFI
ncbi:hypothetical protein EV421DRAFT_1890989 [Armillaria borealis]|uniref:DNA helicase n=1 Tax=Armillaria borealis TaxID=47425 RepID=A0AA39JFZ7_9AGAR|nr:hypothetical protein EV421DRAFT_1890989 [Armillaria borealis]